jgi:hypothetical protein
MRSEWRVDMSKLTKRPIRFFCKDCSKEIWEDLDYSMHSNDRLWALIHCCLCSDCLLKRMKKDF